jgi:hypothetical protein
MAALYVLTGLAGVPAVVRRLPALESREMVAVARASGRATARDIEVLVAAGATVSVHSAFAVFPFVVLVTYDSVLGRRGFPRSTRAVLWFGIGARFLA